MQRGNNLEEQIFKFIDKGDSCAEITFFEREDSLICDLLLYQRYLSSLVYSLFWMFFCPTCLLYSVLEVITGESVKFY